jgi:hypothetical protein
MPQESITAQKLEQQTKVQVDSRFSNCSEEMKKEVEIASWWWTSQLKLQDLSQEQVLAFQNNLMEILLSRYMNHWYEDDPLRGHAYRSILWENNKVDPVLVAAAERSKVKDIGSRINSPPLVMWVDPGEIEVRYFVTSSSSFLYRKNKNNGQTSRIQDLTK